MIVRAGRTRGFPGKQRGCPWWLPSASHRAARRESDAGRSMSALCQKRHRGMLACYPLRLQLGATGGAMITIPELAAEALGSHLAEHMGRRFGSTDPDLVELVQSAARLAVDCIGNSDALYHNVDHTMLVTLVGYDILRGRRLLTETNASDFAHLIIACLYHDIGYVRGILSGDGDDGYIIDAKGNKATLPRGSSDAALMPYHVDRSKLFVLDRVAKIKLLDATRVANAIEFTRFPPPDGASDSDKKRRGNAGTCRQSDRSAWRSALSAQSQCTLSASWRASASRQRASASGRR